MTITLSQDNYLELFEAAIEQPCPNEIIYNYTKQLGSGYRKEIELCQGFCLGIWDYTLHDNLILQDSDREHPVEFVIQILGNSIDEYGTNSGAGHSRLYGSGIAAGGSTTDKGSQRFLGIDVHMEPNLLANFLSHSSELPPELELLIKENDWQNCFPSRKITPTMQVAVQQILHCPYQGLMRQIYLQAKVFELLALQLEPLQGDCQHQCDRYKLKPEDIARIHHARDILLARIDNPPTLVDLARAVGINDRKLKMGFRQVFGTTVFRYLHDYRLEQSRQLLEAGNLTITGIARVVGFANRGYFAAAFRRKFGVNPSAYLPCQRH